MDLKPGTRIKNYTLERQLGKGASGEVWRAYDETKTVAIKFMNENLMSSASAAKHRERLIREVESLRRLQHPNIPTLFDYDLDFVRPYLAMRYVGGDSYDRLISSGEMLKIPLERRLEAIRELAFALTAAHEAGIIHRDIKPANMTGIENPFLLDFSISLGNADAERTQRFVGTTLYMAPDGIVDRLSDNYSFAVVVYEMLFGMHPIYKLGDSLFNQFIAEMRLQNRQWTFPSMIPPAQLPPDLRGADLRQLDAVFERAFGKREERYFNLREFVRDLRGAILWPQGLPAEEAYVASSAPPVQQISTPPAPPRPAPEYVSQPPQVATPPTPEPEPVEEVPPEETDFSEKAFFNLPAVKPSADVLSPSTKIEHSTRPYEYGAQQQRPVQESEFAAPDEGTQVEMPIPRPPVREEEEIKSSGFADPEAGTMMEIRIPKPAPTAPSEADFAAPDEGTRMEMPIPRPPVREEEVESSGSPDPEAMTMMEIRIPKPAAPSEADFAGPEDRTMPEIRIPKPTEPEPADFAGPEDRTMPEIRIPKPAQPDPFEAEFASSEEDRTMPEIDVPKQAEPQPAPVDMDRTMPEISIPSPLSSHFPQGESYTMMEMEAPKPYAPMEEGFTMMEFRAAQLRSYPDPFENDELMQPQKQNLLARLPARTRRLLLIGVIVLVVLVVLLIVIAALTSGARVG